MKKILYIAVVALTALELNGAALSALRSGRSQLQQALSRGSLAPAAQSFTAPAATPITGSQSILQPRGLSTLAAPAYVGPTTLRLYGQRTTDYSDKGQQGGYSSRQVAAALLTLGIGGAALASKVEDTQKNKELYFNKLYGTYAAPFGSVAGLLKHEGAVKTKIVLARDPETVAIDLAKLIATVKDTDAGVLFTDPQAVISVSMIAAASAQAEQILVNKFAQLLNNGSLTCCTNDAQKNLLNQFIDDDTDGSYVLKLATALPWPASLGAAASTWNTLLKQDADIAKTQRWEGGWWSGKYVSTGEKGDAQQTVLRRLAAKSPQAAREITDRMVAQSKLKGFNDLPFYTVDYLVNVSPYAAQTFAAQISELAFTQMVQAQNIAQETALALWQKLQDVHVSRRLQE